jgi:ATP/maltotriose-dependent transcriptional regulator MalT
VRWADRLATARRRGFVGRTAELSRFRTLLADPDEPRVVYVHGPGGVGKTALLHQFAWLAEQAGRRRVWLDGREVAPDAETVAGLLGSLEDDLVLLVDEVQGLDRLLREEVLPRLAAGAVVVLTGRDRPSAQWRADPGWRELVEVMPLGNLAEAEGRKLLLDRGVSADDCDPALAFTRGHPLALALVSDVAAQRRFSVAEEPEVVKALLRGLVDGVPSPQHRLALEASALVLGVTEPLLAALLDQPDVGDLFEWLRGLSIIEPGPHGLFPHDLVRDVLATELRWRDPASHATLHGRAAAYYRDQFDWADPQGRRALLLDFLYLHRDRSVLGPFLSAVTGGLDSRRLWASPPHPEEWSLLRDWVARHEGMDSAALFDHWRFRQPEATSVVRDGQGAPVGFYVLLRVE